MHAQGLNPVKYDKDMEAGLGTQDQLILQQKQQRHQRLHSGSQPPSPSPHSTTPPSFSQPNKQPRNRRTLKFLIALGSLTLLFTIFSQAALPARLAAGLQGLGRFQTLNLPHTASASQHSGKLTRHATSNKTSSSKFASSTNISESDTRPNMIKNDASNASFRSKQASQIRGDKNVASVPGISTELQDWIARERGGPGAAEAMTHPVWWAAPFYSVSGEGN